MPLLQTIVGPDAKQDLGRFPRGNALLLAGTLESLHRNPEQLLNARRLEQDGSRGEPRFRLPLIGGYSVVFRVMHRSFGNQRWLFVERIHQHKELTATLQRMVSDDEE
jgi:hypothetical protein